jgi:hypothetical protein
MSSEKKREDARERGNGITVVSVVSAPDLILLFVALKGHVVPGLFLLTENERRRYSLH